MADRPRFGPAGKPPRFKGAMSEIPKFLHEEGLDAFEYQAVRGVRISQNDAKNLGSNGTKYDVWLTLHGPYFINLCGEKAVVDASKQRLIDSLKAASWMGAHQVVFHPGYYGMRSEQEALDLCVQALQEVVELAERLGIHGVRLGPETTGKPTQVGSLDEILTICTKVEATSPTIDWAHIHARGNGVIKSREDYVKLIDLIEKKLGSEAVKNMHCHYTPVEFTSKGERCHHTMDEPGFGPDFKPLAELIVQLGLKPIIISESPVLDLDSIKMQKMVKEALNAKK
ncbi:TIM barrel protein [Candidatus Bathyarchaeota archaeon]|nr:TIM barrel protein [Candidatus Bathyarchaeota archaeon]